MPRRALATRTPSCGPSACGPPVSAMVRPRTLDHHRISAAAACSPPTRLGASRPGYGLPCWRGASGELPPRPASGASSPGPAAGPPGAACPLFIADERSPGAYLSGLPGYYSPLIALGERMAWLALIPAPSHQQCRRPSLSPADGEVPPPTPTSPNAQVRRRAALWPSARRVGDERPAATDEATLSRADRHGSGAHRPGSRLRQARVVARLLDRSSKSPHTAPVKSPMARDYGVPPPRRTAFLEEVGEVLQTGHVVSRPARTGAGAPARPGSGNGSAPAFGAQLTRRASNRRNV